MRPERLACLTTGALLATPVAAYAATDSVLAVPQWLSFGMGAFALVVSAFVLVEVARLRRLAEGSAFADNMAYVMAGIVALAASALAGWIALLDPEGVDGDQVRIVSDALVGVGMVLLGVYFYRVRRAMRRYLDVLSGVDPLVEVQADRPGGEDSSGA